MTALRAAGATIEGETGATTGEITKQDMMALGLSGGVSSGEKRRQLMKSLGFPERMSANALLQALNLLFTLDELKEQVQRL